MPITITSADYVGTPPATGIQCPADDEKVKASDLQVIAAAVLANDANTDTTKVAKAGDTMTGKLTIAPTGEVTGGVSLAVTGDATNGTAISGEGTGSGFGGGFVGGATGFGVLGQAGGGDQPGVKAQGAGTGPDIECLAGPILFSGTQPIKTADPGANRAHATNIPKAWAYITTDGAGGVTIEDALNVASVTLNVAYIRVNFAGAMANANYAATGNECTGGAFTFNPRMSTSTTTYVEYILKNSTTGATIDPTATAVEVSCHVMARQ